MIMTGQFTQFVDEDRMFGLHTIDLGLLPVVFEHYSRVTIVAVSEGSTAAEKQDAGYEHVNDAGKAVFVVEAGSGHEAKIRKAYAEWNAAKGK